MKRVWISLTVGGLLGLCLAGPVLGVPGPGVTAVFDVGQIGAAETEAGLATAVSAVLVLTNRGDEQVEVSSITSSVHLPELGLSFDFPPVDLTGITTLDPGQVACYGLGGYVPLYRDTAFVVTTTYTVTSPSTGAEVHELTAAGYDRFPGGMVGGSGPQGNPFKCV